MTYQLHRSELAMNNALFFFNDPSQAATAQALDSRDAFLMDDKEQEQAFADYDRAMAAATLSADIDDHYYGQAELSQTENDIGFFYDQEDQESMEVDTEYYDDNHNESGYSNESLLNLILGVQTYLNEASRNGYDQVKDSPLFDLQYKMYMYMKQCACEMGYDISTL